MGNVDSTDKSCDVIRTANEDEMNVEKGHE